MKYVVETTAGFLSYGREQATLESAQVFPSQTSASTARDIAGRSGCSIGVLVPYKVALAKSQSNNVPSAAPVSGF